VKSRVSDAAIGVRVTPTGWRIFMKKLVLTVLAFTASVAGASAADLAARPYTKAPASVTDRVGLRKYMSFVK